MRQQGGNVKDKKNLTQRLMEVRREVSHIEKDARNDFHKFNYVSSAAVLAAIRSSMNDAGILFETTIRKENVEVVELRDSLMTRIYPEYTFRNEDDDSDWRTYQWVGHGVDKMEMGPGKAATYAEKYFLLKFFNIPTPDADPDSTPSAGNGAKQDRNNPPDVGRKPSSDDDFAGTDKQRKLIFAVSKKLWGENRVEGYKRMCAKEGLPQSTSELSRGQVKEAIDCLMRLQDEYDSGDPVDDFANQHADGDW
jgi:hypothetical protein